MRKRERIGSRRPAGGSRRAGGARVAAGVLALALMLLASACSVSSPGTADRAPSPSPSPTLSAARITITPENGRRQARPERGISVTVRDGTLVSVTARSGDGAVAGELDPTATSWRSRWSLPTGRQYVVRATARDSEGRTITKMSRFRTLTPHSAASIQIFEGHNVTYGVGMPVMLAFSRPVEDKKAVERAIVLTSSRKIVGAWYWNGDQALWFRPRAYWPQHVKVGFVGHFDGVAALTRRVRHAHVTAGLPHRALPDRRRQRERPRHEGLQGPQAPTRRGPSAPAGPARRRRTAPTSRSRRRTRSTWWARTTTSRCRYSVRFTWSGDFIHAAPWSVGSQGYANVSHGCVNLAPERARDYYGMSIPGDPVTVTGSPKGGKWDDGWTVWFLSWKELVKGSALRKAVRVGPDGSTWVRPSALKPSRAKAPLGRPKPDNAAPS